MLSIMRFMLFAIVTLPAAAVDVSLLQLRDERRHQLRDESESHRWSLWTASVASPGESCVSDEDCDSSICLGGICCNQFAATENCAKCGKNGFCGGCTSNSKWVAGKGCELQEEAGGASKTAGDGETVEDADKDPDPACPAECKCSSSGGPDGAAVNAAGYCEAKCSQEHNFGHVVKRFCGDGDHYMLGDYIDCTQCVEGSGGRRIYGDVTTPSPATAQADDDESEASKTAEVDDGEPASKAEASPATASAVASPGESCVSDEDCDSSICLGGTCCNQFAATENCETCDKNGFCGGCTSNSKWVKGKGCELQEEAGGASKEAIDCSVEPRSMNGGTYPKGCAGAVWGNGSPARTYCINGDGRFPWWAECCEWTGTECIPKSLPEEVEEEQEEEKHQ